MKQKLLLFASVLLCTISFAQGQKVAFKDWSTNAGIQAMFQKNITKADASGNVYTAGATLNANGKYDIYLDWLYKFRSIRCRKLVSSY